MIGYEDKAKLASARPILVPAEEEVSELRGRYHRPAYQVFKRLFDIVLSALALIVLSPVFLIIALLIAAKDGFPVAFKQTRVGFRGRLFPILKFRTMVKNAEEILKARPELLEEYRVHYKIKNDPRISPIGRFLRKSSLDELPQLWNVLKGDMTLVGPRPIVPPELEMYGEHQDIYKAMKPGCAGLWQCGGRSGTTYEERVQLDREYYAKASLLFDLQILFRTVLAILTGRGAR
ncbi:MAG TPA: sugar transferase [Fimbriimonadaceae bacterium]|nr:sugar transferase [Fimbriimonadaceae bacterium]